MWADIVKSKGTDLIWGRTAIIGKIEFSLDGTRAKDRKTAARRPLPVPPKTTLFSPSRNQKTHGTDKS
jgi:hypothetical protein